MRRRVLLLILFCSVSSLLALGWWFVRLRLIESQCTKNLINLGQLIELYRGDHKGEYPPTLRALFDAEGGDLLGRCPAAARNTHESYCYIDWSRSPREPDWGSTDYPMVYDWQLSNHSGRGVNILLTSGTCIWDSDAAWLRRFATQHSAAKISIPDGDEAEGDNRQSLNGRSER